MGDEVRMVKGATNGLPQTLKDFAEQLEKQAGEMQKMDLNTNKLYTHYKVHLGTNNGCISKVERQVAAFRNEGRTHMPNGVFDFGPNSSSSTNASTAHTELVKMREDIAKLKRSLLANGTQTPM
jgi:hypothetical protein